MALNLGAGNESNLGFTVSHGFRANRRQVEPEIVKTPLFALEETPDERPSIEVTYSGDAQTPF